MTKKLFLAAATLLSGAAAAWVSAGTAAGAGDVLAPVQLMMSVFVAFFGVLAVTDRPRRVSAALGIAAGLAVAGILLTGWAYGSWPSVRQAGGAVLVQLIALFAGTGCGLLIRRPVLAMAATIVVPMTATALLGVVDQDLVRWLTPYGNARSLLAGTPTAGLAVVVLLWCVVPNTLGALDRPGSRGKRRGVGAGDAINLL